MYRLILSAVFLLVVAVLILLNSTYTTSFNLFGKVYENLSVVVIVLLSFVGGILYAFLYFLYGKVRNIGKDRTQRKQQQLKESKKGEKAAAKAIKEGPPEPPEKKI